MWLIHTFLAFLAAFMAIGAVISIGQLDTPLPCREGYVPIYDFVARHANCIAGYPAEYEKKPDAH